MVNVSIQGRVKTIKKEAFSNNKNLEYLYFSNDIDSIDNSAFIRCPKLHHVTYLGKQSPPCYSTIFPDSQVDIVHVQYNYNDIHFCSYPINILASAIFTPSNIFTASLTFSPIFTESFTESQTFTKSQ